MIRFQPGTTWSMHFDTAPELEKKGDSLLITIRFKYDEANRVWEFMKRLADDTRIPIYSPDKCQSQQEQ